jgi:hypothetical protein
VFLRETEKKKYRPGSVVKRMKAEGFTKLGIKQHTDLWKDKNAKDPKKQFGAQVEGSWFWYESWLDEVRKHCEANDALYKPAVPNVLQPKAIINPPPPGPQPVFTSGVESLCPGPPDKQENNRDGFVAVVGLTPQMTGRYQGRTKVPLIPLFPKMLFRASDPAST